MSVVKGFLGTVPALTSDALLTVPVGKRYKILNIVVCNRTATARTFALHVMPGGAVPSDNSGIGAPDFTVPGKGDYTIPNSEGWLLDAGDAIYGEASLAGVLNYIISFAPLGPSAV